MRNLRSGGFSVVLLLSVMGCATFSPPRQSVKDPLQGHASEAILRVFDDRWQGVEDLRALARVSVTSEKGRYTARETVMWRRPAALRLDTLNVFGQPAMALAADPERVSIYYPHQGVFFHGPSTAANLARFIGLPLDVEDAAHLLMGYITPGSRHPWAWIHYTQDRGEHLLRFMREGGELLQDVWVEPEQLLPTRIVRYSDVGAPAVDVVYADFRPLTEMFSFPFSLTISLPLVRTELRLQFTEVDLNPGLPPSVFHLSPPDGARVVPLD